MKNKKNFMDRKEKMKPITIERIKKIVEECLQHYTMGDSKTDKEEKKDFVSRLIFDLNNSNKKEET